ncbi:hypothetical protein LJR143_003901 [Pseudoxanthomonas sp. LjRoot143]|uniref:hypothetical protein n=1 Tax=unclassified Pseudoxanthomonas TaxID=2645906 RepID=UPI001782BEB5|nr:hypothetical protein [Pseudoxanthomonas sp. PXM01]MBD9470862.1 hypothetical protein [Pseudoxanthomonas sp. PXM01]
MNLLVRRRKITVPAGYSERECFLVSYAMPLCKHCFVLCHEPSDPDHPSIDHSVMGFFMAQAHELSDSVTGNAHSFVIIHSGGFVRKRHNLHMHVFVIRRRGQKALLYALLAMVHTTSAVRRVALRLIGREPSNSFKPTPLRGAA